MKSDSLPNNDFQLKVFAEETSIENRSVIFDQLPVLETLTERFEMVTGWKLDFVESHSSFRNRQIFDADSMVFGDLAISDMSDSIAAGTSARHRGYCDQLAESLDFLVKLVQLERQRLHESGVHLNPVVQPPFEWWGLAGNSGFNNGNVSHWSVTRSEQLRLFFANLEGDDHVDTALASSALLAAFDAISQTTDELFDIAPILPSLIQRLDYPDTKLSSFGTIELDPITGEYKLDGFNSYEGLALIDLDARAVVDQDPEENDGILYSGHILCLGVNSEQRERIQQVISNVDLTVEHCIGLIESELPESAAIFIYRK